MTRGKASCPIVATIVRPATVTAIATTLAAITFFVAARNGDPAG